MITPESQVRVIVRPFASALPLGFFSFAIGMLLLAGTGIGRLPVSERHTVGILLAAFVFPLERRSPRSSRSCSRTSDRI